MAMKLRQTDRVRCDPELPIRIHGSPSSILRSGGAREDKTEALPPPDSIILPNEEQTTMTSPSTGNILDVLGSTIPHMSSVSAPERLEEV
ncbi:hypothetical protein PIB30_079180 [Stylosanthes scabra]|uniref:Uncharacterized protein n=1 Tax=Stylosanthes scabra TaxID=79078 RepID=A0ABU6YNN7_9FABA|nr:hypothetical protein [Stylosanthes scabra]